MIGRTLEQVLKEAIFTIPGIAFPNASRLVIKSLDIGGRYIAEVTVEENGKEMSYMIKARPTRLLRGYGIYPYPWDRNHDLLTYLSILYQAKKPLEIELNYLGRRIVGRPIELKFVSVKNLYVYKAGLNDGSKEYIAVSVQPKVNANPIEKLDESVVEKIIGLLRGLWIGIPSRSMSGIDRNGKEEAITTLFPQDLLYEDLKNRMILYVVDEEVLGLFPSDIDRLRRLASVLEGAEKLDTVLRKEFSDYEKIYLSLILGHSVNERQWDVAKSLARFIRKRIETANEAYNVVYQYSKQILNNSMNSGIGGFYGENERKIIEIL